MSHYLHAHQPDVWQTLLCAVAVAVVLCTVVSSTSYDMFNVILVICGSWLPFVPAEFDANFSQF